MTPVNPVVEGLRELESRPQTPTVVGLEKDEREEFLRRENELSDQLAEKESALTTAEKLIKELKEELAFIKEQEAAINKVRASFRSAILPYSPCVPQENKAMSSSLNELRLQVERLTYDNKEGLISIDILKEQNHDLKEELEKLKSVLADTEAAKTDASQEDKEKRKQEKMALMMAEFDAVCYV